MKLYYTKDTSSLVVRIILNELGFEFDAEPVNLKTKKTLSNIDFFNITPKGRVPVLITDKGETLTENSVILQYISDLSQATHLLPEIGNIRRYRVLEWLNYLATDLEKSIEIFFNPNISETLKKTVFTPLITKHLTFLNETLAGKTYLMGDAFTLPDPYLFVMTRWLKTKAISLMPFQNIALHHEKIGERAATIRSLKEETF